ncbi:hypothetical protein BIW11_12868, partial [Tropilaelaps mercedesae]
ESRRKLEKLSTSQQLPDASEGNTRSPDPFNVGESISTTSQNFPKLTAANEAHEPNDFDSLVDEHLVTVVAPEWTQNGDQKNTDRWPSAMARHDDSPVVVTSSPELTSISTVETEAARQNQSIPGACHSDGAWFMEGSAMLRPRKEPTNSNSSLTVDSIFHGCSFCYCLRGRRRCVRPRCALRVPGCTPRYADPSDCCPVGYDCIASQSMTTDTGESARVTSTERTTTTTASTTQRTSVPIGGCLHKGRVYGVGAVLPIQEPCRTCICFPRGPVCSPVECPLAAPACVGITPPGHCCPTEYICDTIRNTHNETEQLKIIPDPRPGSVKEIHLFRKLDHASFEEHPTTISENRTHHRDVTLPTIFSTATTTSSTGASTSQGTTESSDASSVSTKDNDARSEKTFSSPGGKGQGSTQNDQEKNVRLLPSEVQLEKKPTANSSQELHEWKLASNKVIVDASHINSSANGTINLFYTPEVILDPNLGIDAIELLQRPHTTDKSLLPSEESSTNTEATPAAVLRTPDGTLTTPSTEKPEQQDTTSSLTPRVDPPEAIDESPIAKVTKSSHLHLNLDLIDFRTNRPPEDHLTEQQQPIYVPEEQVERISARTNDNAPTIRPIFTESNEVVSGTPPKRVQYTTEVPKFTVPVYLAEASSPTFSKVQSVYIGSDEDGASKLRDQQRVAMAQNGSGFSSTSEVNANKASATESVDLEGSASTTLASYTKLPVDIDAKLSRTSNNKKSTFTVNLGSHITVAYDSAEVTTEEGITTAKESEFSRDVTLRQLLASTAPPPSSSTDGNVRSDQEPPTWGTPPTTRATSELPTPTESIFTLEQKQLRDDHLTPTETANVKLTKKHGDDVTTIPGLIISTPSSLLKAAHEQHMKGREDDSSSSVTIPYIITTSDVVNNEYRLRQHSRQPGDAVTSAETTTPASTTPTLRVVPQRSQAELIEPSGQSSSTTANVIYRDLGPEPKSIDAQQLNKLNQLLNAEDRRKESDASGATHTGSGGPPVSSPKTGSIDFAEGVKLFSTLLLSGLAMSNRRETTTPTQILSPVTSLAQLPSSGPSPPDSLSSTANPSNADSRRYQRPPLYQSAIAFDNRRPDISGPQLYQFSSAIPIPVTAHPLPLERNNELGHKASPVRKQQLKPNYAFDQPRRREDFSPQQYYVDDPTLSDSAGVETQSPPPSPPPPPSYAKTEPSRTTGPSTGRPSSNDGPSTSSRPTLKQATTQSTRANNGAHKPTIVFNTHLGEPPFTQGSNCFINGATYADGEDIPKADACELCRCYFGEELCTIRRCPQPPGSDCRAEPVPGSCCPRYTCKPESVTLPPSAAGGPVVDDGFHQPDHPKFVPHIDILMAPQGDQRLLPYHHHSTHHGTSAKGSQKGTSTTTQQGFRRGGSSSNWKKGRPLPSPSYNPFFPGPRRDTPPPRPTPTPTVLADKYVSREDLVASTTALPVSTGPARGFGNPSGQTPLPLENEIAATSDRSINRHTGADDFTTIPTATLEALLQHAAAERKPFISNVDHEALGAQSGRANATQLDQPLPRESEGVNP